ncbi:MAG: XTP/dITP diphosphatase [Clostridia bacterium]|nr:XTP/dITP diphosphatase [Clostridia bacterium]
MKVIAATKNKGKIREMTEILSPLGIEIVPQEEVGIEVDVEETGDTFEKNALIKARAVRMVSDYPVLADDSGLCVDALDGAPGVRSARYAGDNATDEDKINKLLSEIGEAENRNARFVTSVAFIFEDGREVTAEGSVDGSITKEPHGEGGFGYDPVFYSPELGKTFAESTDDEKNSVSHRGRALKNLFEKLKNMEA